MCDDTHLDSTAQFSVYCHDKDHHNNTIWTLIRIGDSHPRHVASVNPGNTDCVAAVSSIEVELLLWKPHSDGQPCLRTIIFIRLFHCRGVTEREGVPPLPPFSLGQLFLRLRSLFCRPALSTHWLEKKTSLNAADQSQHEALFYFSKTSRLTMLCFAEQLFFFVKYEEGLIPPLYVAIVFTHAPTLLWSQLMRLVDEHNVRFPTFFLKRVDLPFFIQPTVCFLSSSSHGYFVCCLFFAFVKELQSSLYWKGLLLRV